MSLSDLAALGSFVSGAAVLVSLIFLYFQLKHVRVQIKQAEKNQQAAIRQGRSSRVTEILMGIAEPSLAEATAKGMAGASGMSNTQIAQFRNYCSARFFNAEDYFYQHQEGLLNDVAFASFSAALKSGFALPGMRVMWKWMRRSYGIEFVEFIDKLVSETPSSMPPDLNVRWEADIAAEHAGANPHVTASPERKSS